MGERAYRGETDPRKLRLIVAAGFGNDVLRINGVKHVRIEELVLRGATGSPMIHIHGSQDIHLDHLTAYGGFPALLINASQKVRVTRGSPAIDAGVEIPTEWPAPLRAADKGKPDIGAIPLGSSSWGVGVDGRMSVFGGRQAERVYETPTTQ